MKRREVMMGLGAAVLVGCRSADRHETPLAFTLPEPPVVHITTQEHLRVVGSDTLGVSLETATLSDPAFLAADDVGLIGLLRGLGTRGVLHLGGRSSDTALWRVQSAGSVAAPYTCAVDVQALERLAGVLDACGWSLVYGIDFVNGSAQRAAAEAVAVQHYLGNRLLALQFGHAPDRYAQDYSVADYAAAWRSYAQAVRDAVPGVPLAGPEAEGPARAAWTSAFVDRCGSLLRVVTAAEREVAPPLRLRRQYEARRESSKTKPAGVPDTSLQAIMATARSHSLPARVTQAAMVRDEQALDTLEAALWAIQTFYARLDEGWSGVCFHAALKNPAARAKTRSLLPLTATALAGPLYYGLRLLSQTLGSQRVATTLEGPPQRKAVATAPAHLHAWALLDVRERVQLVLVNEDHDQSADIRVTADRKLTGGTILRLAGPSFDAKDQVTLAAGAVDAGGQWQPQYTEAVQWAGGTGWLTVGAASAVLVLFD